MSFGVTSITITYMKKKRKVKSSDVRVTLNMPAPIKLGDILTAALSAPPKPIDMTKDEIWQTAQALQTK